MSNFEKACRLWRTVRWLRLTQIIWRVVYKIVPPKVRYGNLARVRQSPQAWVKPVAMPSTMTGTTCFSMMGHQHDIRKGGWNPSHLPKLYVYNLHYFADLNAEGASKRIDWHIELIRDWLLSNPPVEGEGWEPYPVSLRIVNWIKSELADHRALENLGRECLALQARFLRSRLEWHLLGNHLFANAKALVFAGLYFEGPESEDWLETGLSILEEQISEQILSDGGQFELSPMYHALAIEDLLDLINIAIAYADVIPSRFTHQMKRWPEIVQRMFTWLATMSHPDGGISFFNDAAFGVAPTLSQLQSYAERLNLDLPQSPSLGLNCLPQSGYVRMENSSAVGIFDAASIGPDYLPGHAHADSLSFELSIAQSRVVVNSGTSQYGEDTERQRQRGTAAHSTLCLEGQNSSEVWGGFRTGRRASIQKLETKVSGDVLSLYAAHDGYVHLSGCPVHHRRWTLEEGRLTILDELSGTGLRHAKINFHLAAGITAKRSDGGSVSLLDPAGVLLASVLCSQPNCLSILDSTWHPEFGTKETTHCLSVNAYSQLPFLFETVFEWAVP